MKPGLEVQSLHFWVFYYSESNIILFLFVDNIPNIGYTIEERRCGLYVYNGKAGSRTVGDF